MEPACGSPVSPAKSRTYTSARPAPVTAGTIACRFGIKPIRSTAGLLDAVPVAGLPSNARISVGPRRNPAAACSAPCTASAAPVMMGDADEVPLNVAVYSVVEPAALDEHVSTFSPHA